METVFVTRTDGSVNSVTASRQFEGQEELPESHPDVIAYLASTPAWKMLASVPRVVPAGNFMRALVRLDRYATLNAYIAAIPGKQGDELRVLWARATEFDRQHPDLIAVAHAVGMTDADIDAVFSLAVTF